MNIITNRTTRIRTEHRMEIGGKDLLTCINQELAAIGADRIPADAGIVVWVPGGADWSNTDLSLHEHPVVITWAEVEEETDQ